MTRWAMDKFTSEYKATIGSDFLTKDGLGEGGKTTLQLWDTAGQERFQSLDTFFYRGADAFIVFVDGSQPLTYKNNPRRIGWSRDDIARIVNVPEGKFLPIIIAVTKSELDQQLSDDDIADLKAHYQTKRVVYCSAKTGAGIRDEGCLLQAAVLKVCAEAAQKREDNETVQRVALENTRKRHGSVKKPRISFNWPSWLKLPSFSRFRQPFIALPHDGVWANDLFKSFVFGLVVALCVLVALGVFPPASHVALIAIDAAIKFAFNHTLSGSLAAGAGLDAAVVALSVASTFIVSTVVPFVLATMARLTLNSRLFVTPGYQAYTTVRMNSKQGSSQAKGGSLEENAGAFASIWNGAGAAYTAASDSVSGATSLMPGCGCSGGDGNDPL